MKGLNHRFLISPRDNRTAMMIFPEFMTKNEKKQDTAGDFMAKMKEFYELGERREKEKSSRRPKRVLVRGTRHM